MLDVGEDEAVNIVLNKLERGIQPTEADLIAADLCVKCAGFGFFDYEDDGFTEIPCDHCKPTS